MTSFRQWQSNRENAQKSTGPRSQEGKRRSRRNALRHGLTAQTVIEELEDSEDYRAFEATIIADYDARTAVARELVLRLASLLWRIRRATGIETDLLRIQAEILRERHKTCRSASDIDQPSSNVRNRVLTLVPQGLRGDLRNYSDKGQEQLSSQSDDGAEASTSTAGNSSREITFCFLRLANLDNGVFERLGRYEATLWRQVVQTLMVLHPSRDRYRY